jgi:parvulin-like peptidyl-prolyl isomerase
MRNLIASLIIALSLVLTACGPDYIAEVNGEKVTLKDFKRVKKTRIEEYKAAGAKFDEKTIGRTVLDELITKSLILEGATAGKIKVSDNELQAMLSSMKHGMPDGEFEKRLKKQGLKMKDFIEDLTDQMTIEKFRRSFADMRDVPFEEVKKQYDMGNKPVLSPERMKVREIRLGSEEGARELYSEIKSSSFENVADKLPGAGGAASAEPQWVDAGYFSPVVSKTLKEVPSGKYSSPVRDGTGWHIVKVYERQSAKVATFEEAKERMMINMIEAKRNEAFNKWLMDVQGKAKIKIKEKYLK